MQLGEKIAKMDEVCCVHSITGDYDLLVSLKCFGNEECSIHLK
ncbi:MAG: Lrp/AsnC ligand binding domain-containing protein [Candidatus Syntropharchaeia archaeon]